MPLVIPELIGFKNIKISFTKHKAVIFFKKKYQNLFKCPAGKVYGQKNSEKIGNQKNSPERSERE
jgi:hypothetical protein